LGELKRDLPNGLYGIYVDRVIRLDDDSESDQPPLRVIAVVWETEPFDFFRVPAEAYDALSRLAEKYRVLAIVVACRSGMPPRYIPLDEIPKVATYFG
jgi:hypothetical protein